MQPANPKTAVAPRARVRLLLIVLGIGALFGLAYRIRSAGAPGTAPPNQARDAREGQETVRARGSLEVELDHLKKHSPSKLRETRSLFSFHVQPTPPPKLVVNTPPPLAPFASRQPGQMSLSRPPIPIKFIGVVEQGTTRVAVFSDGKGPPVWASEGQTVLGQYKLLKIGVESVTMSYVDGKGVQTIPMRG